MGTIRLKMFLFYFMKEQKEVEKAATSKSLSLS